MSNVPIKQTKENILMESKASSGSGTSNRYFVLFNGHFLLDVNITEKKYDRTNFTSNSSNVYFRFIKLGNNVVMTQHFSEAVV